MTRLQFPIPTIEHHIQRLGMTHHPFPAVPDGNHYYMHETLQALLHEVLFTLNQKRGFVVITGEVGLGKSTFSRVLLQELSMQQAATALVLNSVVQEAALLEQIIADFGLTPNSKEVSELLQQLNHFLLANKKNDITSVVVIDDAQNLTPASLELIRLLTSLETSSEKLLQIVLLGQPELQYTLNTKALRQLKSRIALSRQFLPFSKAQMLQYIIYKTTATERHDVQVSATASSLLYRATRGVPRLVNLLMDRVLILLAARNTVRVSASMVRLAIADVGDEFFYCQSAKQRLVRCSAWVIAFLIVVFVTIQFSLLSKMQTYYVDWLHRKNDLVVENYKEIKPEAATREAVLEAADSQPDMVEAEPERKVEPALHTEVVQPKSGAFVAGNGKENRTESELAQRALAELRRRLLPSYNAPSLWQVYSEQDILSALNSQNSTTIINWLQRSSTLQVVSLPVHAISEQGKAACFVIKHDCIFTWKGVSSLTGELSNMQIVLANANLYSGEIDGVLGLQTLSAIKKLQFILGLPATASLDQATLFALYHIQFFRI